MESNKRSKELGGSISIRYSHKSVIYVSSIQLKHEAAARKLLFEVTHEDLSNLFLRNVLSQLFLVKCFPKHRQFHFLQYFERQKK